jgi:hypothetical protein
MPHTHTHAERERERKREREKERERERVRERERASERERNRKGDIGGNRVTDRQAETRGVTKIKTEMRRVMWGGGGGTDGLKSG